MNETQMTVQKRVMSKPTKAEYIIFVENFLKELESPQANYVELGEVAVSLLNRQNNKED